MRILAVVGLALGCASGPRLHLPGHELRYESAPASRELPPVTLKTGTVEKLVTYHGGSHAHAIETVAVGEEPGIFDCVSRPDEAGRRATFLRALRAGTTRAHYVSSAEAKTDATSARAKLAEKQEFLHKYAGSSHTATYTREYERWHHVEGVDVASLGDTAALALYLRGSSVGSFQLTVAP